MAPRYQRSDQQSSSQTYQTRTGKIWTRITAGYFRRHTDNFGSDPRANPSQDPNGVFRGDRDDRPSLMYGRSNFDDDEPDGSGYDHAGHLDDLRGLDDHTSPEHPDDDNISNRDAT